MARHAQQRCVNIEVSFTEIRKIFSTFYNSAPRSVTKVVNIFKSNHHHKCVYYIHTYIYYMSSTISTNQTWYSSRIHIKTKWKEDKYEAWLYLFRCSWVVEIYFETPKKAICCLFNLCLYNSLMWTNGSTMQISWWRNWYSI